MENQNEKNLDRIKSFAKEINAYCGSGVLFTEGSDVLVSEDTILAPVMVEDELVIPLKTPLDKKRIIEQLIGIHGRLTSLLQENQKKLEKYVKTLD